MHLPSLCGVSHLPRTISLKQLYGWAMRGNLGHGMTEGAPHNTVVLPGGARCGREGVQVRTILHLGGLGTHPLARCPLTRCYGSQLGY